MRRFRKGVGVQTKKYIALQTNNRKETKNEVGWDFAVCLCLKLE